MKKIFYLVFFISLCFLVNVNIAEAKNVQKMCYYKTSDSKITFAIKNYDDGTADAILMKPYSKSDFGENKSYGETWKNIDSSLNGSTCNTYMKYTIKTGFNSFEFSNSKPSSSTGNYILTNYNFEDNASKCVYKGLQHMSSDYQITYTVYIDKNSVFTYFNNDLNTAMNNSYTAKAFLVDPDSITYKTEDIYTRFMKYFYDSTPGCPVLDHSYYSGTVKFSAGDDSVNSSFGIISESYADDVNVDKVLKEYKLNFYEHNKDINAEFYIRAYNSGKEEICTKVDESLNCTSIDRNLDEILLYRGNVNNEWVMFKIKQNNVSEIFQYEKVGDYSTLIKPLNVCFNNSGSYGTYYLSKDCDSSSIPSESGENYQEKICILQSRLLNLDFDKSLYKLDFYEINSSNYKTYSIDSIPCSSWGYNYNYDCSNNSCSEELLNNEINNNLEDIQEYCVNIYSTFNKNSQTSINRMNECISFENFYDQLVANGIINDLSEGCDILSKELKQYLVWILDIIKIAGPLLALGLGTLDFIKVLANGDADKEMKTAFKRFMARLGAAALLFIIPLILAFLLDVFLGNQDGYDSDNPFCIEIDWNE